MGRWQGTIEAGEITLQVTVNYWKTPNSGIKWGGTGFTAFYLPVEPGELETDIGLILVGGHSPTAAGTHFDFFGNSDPQGRLAAAIRGPGGI